MNTAYTPTPRVPSRPSHHHQTRHTDQCGLGFVARTDTTPKHETVVKGLEALARLEHRGGIATDGISGDGAGIATQIPRWLLGTEATALGMVFLPQDNRARTQAQSILVAEAEAENLKFIGWRDVPCDPAALGEAAQQTLPVIRQMLVRDVAHAASDHVEKRLYLARRRAQRRFAAAGLAGPDVLHPAYVCSLSSRTVVYKAMCNAPSLAAFYPDLSDPQYETAAAVFHRRFSTNTAPSWPLVQPLRMCAHNGEFNTLSGNVSWLRAREARMGHDAFGDAARDIVPVVAASDSDSVTFDRLFELLVVGGREPEAVMTMLCPEPHAHMPDMDASVRAMCRYHSELIEPWDGPAAAVYFDGRCIGAGLDRNGLRPFRYAITEDGWISGGSESGLLGVPDHKILERGRLGPGHSVIVDLVRGGIRKNDQIKLDLAAQKPYAAWVEEGLGDRATGVDDATQTITPCAEPDLLTSQHLFGYSKEDIERILVPMMTSGKPPVGSMGDDTPLAAMSARPQLLYRFFKQRFAQVTNPPIDSVREQINMSLETSLGRYASVFRDSPDVVRCTRLDSPIISECDLMRICHLAKAAVDRGERESVVSLPAVFDIESDDLEPAAVAMQERLGQICDDAAEAVKSGAGLIILSDRPAGPGRAPLPMLLTVAAVHERLIQEGTRIDCSIVCDTGEAREDHHIACLIGFGATLVLPYLAFRTVAQLATEELPPDTAAANYRDAVESGLLKVMAKMGVTVIQSYRGAGLFESIGLDPAITAAHFPAAPAFPGRVSYEAIAGYQLARHAKAYPVSESGTEQAGPEKLAPEKLTPEKLTEDGTYRYRGNGETHANAPAVFKALHKAVRSGDPADYAKYTAAADALPPVHPRDLMKWTPDAEPVSLDDVEPISQILDRLTSQAMSHGALSREAHETLAIAANRLGMRSNSGEGGELPERFVPYTIGGQTHNKANNQANTPPEYPGAWSPGEADHGNSAIKQVATGRFGVSATYLASARELEIKMAQGAKPGEGGQIPGFKVSDEIGRMRHTAAGTPLISPPPHHDIYSIEDLAQLIHDLKVACPGSPVAVKLVASMGVGTIACGVAKAGADIITIAGADGGTGAAGLSSIKHAGLPWEVGLSVTQHALVEAGLRGRVRLRTDGGMATGKDVVTAAMLGADEVGFGTTALIAAGCVMARRCHDNTCPVGVATQDPRLRAKFPGTPEHVIALFSFVAEEVRQHLASLGAKSLGEMVGRCELLSEAGNSPAIAIDAIIASPAASGPRSWQGERNTIRPVDTDVGRELLRAAEPAANGIHQASFESPISIVDRSIGAGVAGLIGKARLSGKAGPLPITATFTGSSGQSFGAFCTGPMRLELIGTAQDGVGKSMSGGVVIVRPDDRVPASLNRSTIAGNTLLYGATGGEAFFGGAVGERFCVRNSGATAVAEGCGDHGCEYMTGGTVAVLGRVGRNFGAGMTGGIAYVLDPDSYLMRHCDTAQLRIMPLTPVQSEHARALITRHQSATRTRVSAKILGDWSTLAGRFVAVCPASSSCEPPAQPGPEGGAPDRIAEPKPSEAAGV